VRIHRFSLSFCLLAALVALQPAGAADAPKAAPKAKAKAAPAAAKQAKGKVSLDDSFKVFCGEWGKKLNERETFNIKQIKWDTGQNWVQGTYIGYSEPLSCAVEPDSGVVPIGKIIYHEFVYEKRGATVPEAQREPSKAVETTEVTEIFRYTNGKWVY
jgi:hypothetical protein